MPCELCSLAGYCIHRDHCLASHIVSPLQTHADKRLIALQLLCRLLEQGHVAFLQTVPFRVITAFTILQFIGLAAVYVVSSWTGVSAMHFSLI